MTNLIAVSESCYTYIKVIVLGGVLVGIGSESDGATSEVRCHQVL